MQSNIVGCRYSQRNQGLIASANTQLVTVQLAQIVVVMFRFAIQLHYGM